MKYIALFISLFLVLSLSAQYDHLSNDTIRVRKNEQAYDGLIVARNLLTKKYGFVDTNGNTRIAFDYKFTYGFNNQAALVLGEEGVFYIDTSGVRLFQKTFTDGALFYNDLAIVTEDGRSYGVINKQGDYIIPPFYDGMYSAQNKYFVVLLNGKFGVINLEGEIVIPIEYEEIQNFNCEVFFVQTNSKFAVAVPSGEFKSDFIYDRVFFDVGDKYAYLTQAGDKVLCDLKGDIVEDLGFDSLGRLHEGRRKAERGGMVGYLDQDYETVIPYKYDSGSTFRRGVAIVKVGGLTGLIDQDGVELFPLQYQSVWRIDPDLVGTISGDSLQIFHQSGELFSPTVFEPVRDRDSYKFSRGLMRTKKNGRYGFLNSEGVLIIEHLYEASKMLNSKAVNIAVKKDGKWGVVDIDHGTLLPFEFDDVTPGYGESLILRQDGKMKLAVRSVVITEPGYDDMQQSTRDLFVVRNEEKYGLIDTSGSMILPLIYDGISREEFGDGHFLVKEEDRYGLYHLQQGEIILEPEYASIEVVYSGSIIVLEQDGQFGVTNNEGQLLLPMEYDEIRCTTLGVRIIKAGKAGLLSKRGNLILEPIYDEIDLLTPFKAKARQGENETIIEWGDDQ